MEFNEFDITDIISLAIKAIESLPNPKCNKVVLDNIKSVISKITPIESLEVPTENDTLEIMVSKVKNMELIECVPNEYEIYRNSNGRSFEIEYKNGNIFRISEVTDMPVVIYKAN